jgi:hypothetical protein
MHLELWTDLGPCVVCSYKMYRKSCDMGAWRQRPRWVRCGWAADDGRPVDGRRATGALLMGGGRWLSWGRSEEKAELVTGDGDSITVVLHGPGIGLGWPCRGDQRRWRRYAVLHGTVNWPRIALSRRSKAAATASSWLFYMAPGIILGWPCWGDQRQRRRSLCSAWLGSLGWLQHDLGAAELGMALVRNWVVTHAPLFGSTRLVLMRVGASEWEIVGNGNGLMGSWEIIM